LTTPVPLDGNAALSRRGFLGAASVAAAGTMTAGVLAPRATGARVVDRLLAAGADVPVVPNYVSRPDLLPPPISILVPDAGSTPGHILLAPFSFPATPPSTEASGPLIVDRKGQPLWFRPLTTLTAIDLRVQHYHGAPVLTWWEGAVFGGYGGTFVIADQSYTRVAGVKAGNGYKADLHEILITSRNTALISIYNEIHTDLSRIGGPVDGRLVEGIIQEIDIPSGRVLFEWHSLDHVGLEESFEPEVTQDGNVDYFHLNSIGVDHDGHLLASARNTSAVYKIHRRTGQVIWRLGGKRSDFTLGPGLAFGYQHDARRHSDGTLTIFDNNASLPTQHGISSGPLRLRLDTSAKTATLARGYQASDVRTSWAMGNAQQVADGGVFVGWGTYPGFSEIGPDGALRFDARFMGTSVTYRARRQQWVGRPVTRPALASAVSPSGSTIVYASWNGATEVARWQVWAGSSASDLRPVRTFARRGFETAIALATSPRYIAVAALDRSGAVLGTSRPVAA
jgi:Arylsulfotransferase (ASST)